MKQMRIAATSLQILSLRPYSLSLSSYLGGHTSGAQRSEQASLRAAFTILWKEILRCAQNDGYGAPPFSVILNGGCRSEESHTASATSVTQSLKESPVRRSETGKRVCELRFPSPCFSRSLSLSRERAKVRAVATQLDRARTTLHSSQRFAKIERELAFS
jgi:hypothetical protein